MASSVGGGRRRFLRTGAPRGANGAARAAATTVRRVVG